MAVPVCISQHMGGAQRTFESWFSPVTSWVPGIQLRCSLLAQRALTDPTQRPPNGVSNIIMSNTDHKTQKNQNQHLFNEKYYLKYGKKMILTRKVSQTNNYVNIHSYKRAH